MAEPAPPLPGYWRFGWLVFMQPLKLHEMFRAWGLERDPSWWSLRRRLAAGDPVVRGLLGRAMFWQVGVMPLAAVAVAVALQSAGVAVNWEEAAIGLASGMAVGLASGMAVGVGYGVAVGVGFGVAGGVAVGVAVGGSIDVAFAVAVGVAGGVAGGVAFGIAFGRAVRAAEGMAFGVALGVVFGVVFGVAHGVVFGVVFGVAHGVAYAVAFILSLIGLPTYTLEAAFTWCVSRLYRSQLITPARAATLLPFRHHEAIRFPLPGLADLLVQIAEADPSLGTSLLAEAAESVGQKKAARRALVELWARSLEAAIRDRMFARAAAGRLPFVPAASPPPELAAFLDAARDLDAATITRSYRHREAALKRAREYLLGSRLEVTGSHRPSPLATRLLPTTRLWLAVIDDELARLAQERAAHPQVWSPFRVGPPLTREDSSLFRGRADLVRLIDQDVAGERSPLLWLWGQRRMGKSSLLNLLPTQLGTGMRVVHLDFQRLGGEADRGRPHLLVARALGLPAEPGPWRTTLDQLRTLDHRVLVTIDEVEGLQKGIEEGWATADFLDFLRAASNAVPHVRFLVVSAFSPPRLGPHWVDRLVDLRRREVNLLDDADARSLVTAPTPDFPDIYPPGGVDRIVAETAGHPYLLQLVCDALCRHLNDRDRLRGTPDDLDAAFDRAFGETQLFDELWRQRTDPEKEALRRLASAPLPADGVDGPLRDLLAERFVTRRAGRLEITVPMFATWIADRA